MPTLSRNVVIALAMLLASSAVAEEPEPDVPDEPAFTYVASYEFKRPKALRPDHDLSMKLSETLLQEQFFGGLPATVVADASVGQDAWAFYIFDISASDRANQPEQIVRDTFDQLRSGSGDVVSWKENVENNVATATMEWRHEATQTLTLVENHMWVTAAGAPHQLRAECIMHAERVHEIRPRCAEAFAALTIKATDRGALGALPTASKPAVQPRPGDVELTATPSLRPPTEGAVLYNQPPQNTPKRDNTFLYVGGAILLIVAVYMAMRRSSGDEGSDSDVAKEPGDE